MAESNDLKAVVDASPQLFKIIGLMIGVAFLAGMYGWSIKQDINTMKDADLRTARSIEQLIIEIKEEREATRELKSALFIHDEYGEHRDSKPDIDRLDRDFLQLKLKQDQIIETLK